MQSAERGPLPYRRGLIIVATLATAYVASHFFRAANVTIGLDLMRDLGIGPEALGALTGAFFFGFAAMQIPCGFLFDRYGPRHTVTGMLVVASPRLRPCSRWRRAGRNCDRPRADGRRLRRDADRQHGGDLALVSARPLLDAGRRGAVGRPVRQPLRHHAARLGVEGDRLARRVRRHGGVHGAGDARVWLVVRDAPPGHPFLSRKTETPGEMLRGLREVLRNPQLRILALNFCNYACTFTVQGLWGGPFLREVHGLSPIEAGNVLLVAVIAYQVGMLAIGPLDRVFDTRKGIAIAGTLLIVAMLATLALCSTRRCGCRWRHHRHRLPQSSSTMVMTHGRGIFPDRLIGRGIATMNTSVMLGVACMQTLSGMIVGAFPPLPDGARTEEAYRTLFGMMVLVLLVAVAAYSRSTDVRPSDEMRAAGR